MENLIYCLNATIPIFLTLVMGYIFRRIGLFDHVFVSRLNKFVFHAAIPALLFEDMASADFYEVWDTKMILFCFFATLAIISISTGLSFFLKSRDIQGEFIQASYRSSAAILGIAIIQNLYGNPGMAPLMIAASVPLYNVMAVAVLSFFRPKTKGFSPIMAKNTLKGIVTNPIILGIFFGLLWSLLQLPLPKIISSTIHNLGCTATPLGLMAMGGALHLGKAFSRPWATLACAFLKLAGYTALFLPIAVMLGFRQDKLTAILIMLGSATTVSCYIMAKNMGHEGSFTSSMVMITTLLSSFTLTGWLFLCKSLDLI